jgi:thiamine-phosphate pyrophosphorylase
MTYIITRSYFSGQYPKAQQLPAMERVKNSKNIYRVLDANLNRLREALRVIEEYYRFIEERPAVCVRLKRLRHELVGIEAAIDKKDLLAARDTAGDCFADHNRPEELHRNGPASLLSANFKRGQEACRVIEEYAKIVAGAELSGKAKKIRFALYTFEKELSGGKKEGISRQRRARRGKRNV